MIAGPVVAAGGCEVEGDAECAGAGVAVRAVDGVVVEMGIHIELARRRPVLGAVDEGGDAVGCGEILGGGGRVGWLKPREIHAPVFSERWR